jgi:hypothetical protein
MSGPSPSSNMTGWPATLYPRESWQRGNMPHGILLRHAYSALRIQNQHTGQLLGHVDPSPSRSMTGWAGKLWPRGS